MQKVSQEFYERHDDGSKMRFAPLILMAALVAATDILAAWLLARVELGQAARIAVALLPVPANGGLILVVLRGIRRLDEFQKRIHFEAVAVAFLTTGLAALMYGYLQKAQMVNQLNAGFVWAFMCIVYAFGYLISARYYK